MVTTLIVALFALGIFEIYTRVKAQSKRVNQLRKVITEKISFYKEQIEKIKAAKETSPHPMILIPKLTKTNDGKYLADETDFDESIHAFLWTSHLWNCYASSIYSLNNRLKRPLFFFTSAAEEAKLMSWIRKEEPEFEKAFGNAMKLLQEYKEKLAAIPMNFDKETAECYTSNTQELWWAYREKYFTHASASVN